MATFSGDVQYSQNGTFTNPWKTQPNSPWESSGRSGPRLCAVNGFLHLWVQPALSCLSCQVRYCGVLPFCPHVLLRILGDLLNKNQTDKWVNLNGHSKHCGKQKIDHCDSAHASPRWRRSPKVAALTSMRSPGVARKIARKMPGVFGISRSLHRSAIDHPAPIHPPSRHHCASTKALKSSAKAAVPSDTNLQGLGASGTLAWSNCGIFKHLTPKHMQFNNHGG